MSGGSFERIVVATDGSPSAASAVKTAAELAQRLGSELLIVAVAPLAPVFTPPNEPYLPASVPEDPVPRYRALVESAVDLAQEAGAEHVTGVCEEGDVVEELLARLAESHADLLVVGSRGLSTAQRLLLGSVSTAMVHRAPCPVLVVRESVTTPPAPER